MIQQDKLQVLLCLGFLVAGYFSAVCMTPPNPSSEQKSRNKNDRVAIFATLVHLFFRQLAVMVIVYHALLTIIPVYVPSFMNQICPGSAHINPQVFSWSMSSILALTMIGIGSYVRISAYGGLGRLFTFHLVAPDYLVTDGIYKWVQHPSYTGQMILVTGFMALFTRWDGALACWIGDSTFSALHGWGYTAWTLIMSVWVWILLRRVADEEMMLEEKFGKQWMDWHRSTKRFIPGLL